jgi:catechol 2,3-dioxygenase-like lactoylglutathione lyase family enzyme
MTVEFNHTIVSARDAHASAACLSEIQGLERPRKWGPFEVVVTDNGVNIDFTERAADITTQHYAFLVGEAEFDRIFERIREKELTYWADPGRTRQGEINHHDGGRGNYFLDPNGHVLEILTRPYGSGGWNP